MRDPFAVTKGSMDSQLNIVDVSDLAGLRREPCSRVACRPGAERPAEGDGTPGFLAILLQGLADEAPPSSPVPQEEGSGNEHVPSDVDENAEPVIPDGEPSGRAPVPVSEETPGEQMSPDRSALGAEGTARAELAEPEKAEEPAEDGTGPSENRGREVVAAQEETEDPEGSAPALKLSRAPAPEQGEPAELRVRTPQQMVASETAEPAETHARPPQETAMVSDKAPETAEAAGLTRSPEIVGEPPASDESFATEQPSPKEADPGSEPKQPVETLTAPADGRLPDPRASRWENGSEAGAETKPEMGDSAAEPLREGSEHVPPGPQEARADTKHLLETPRDMGHGLPNAAGREPVLASGEPEQPLLNALDARQPAMAPTMAPGADAVSSVESSLGAETTGGDSQQSGLGAPARGLVGPQAESAPDAEAADRLDSIFKQVLSTARLPVDLRERIELARSIGRQIARNAVVSVRNGQTHVLLQLRPPSLGTVRMHLTTENQTVSARMVVENEVVRQAVEQHVQHLRSVLRNEGFNLDRFEVSVRTQAEADAWASAHAESNGRHADRAGGPDRLEAATESGDAEDVGGEAVLASTHNGTVDYLA